MQNFNSLVVFYGQHLDIFFCLSGLFVKPWQLTAVPDSVVSSLIPPAVLLHLYSLLHHSRQGLKWCNCLRLTFSESIFRQTYQKPESSLFATVFRSATFSEMLWNASRKSHWQCAAYSPPACKVFFLLHFCLIRENI